MQPAVAAGRQVAQRAVPTLLRQVDKPAASKAQQELPEWLTEAGSGKAREAASTQDEQPKSDAKATDPALRQSQINSVRYDLYIGAKLPMFSTAERETELRNMHEVNHRELPISKLAARVADFIWPRCQENIDEAIAEAKAMSAKRRVHIEELVYEPPEVPKILPVTSWIRNNKNLRDSFICDHTTRYKPRLTFYNPNDGMIPSNWFTEGLMGDLNYYRPFGGPRQPGQEW